MSAADVSREMREPVFRVRAPDTPNTVTANGMKATSFVPCCAAF